MGVLLQRRVWLVALVALMALVASLPVRAQGPTSGASANIDFVKLREEAKRETKPDPNAANTMTGISTDPPVTLKDLQAQQAKVVMRLKVDQRAKFNDNAVQLHRDLTALESFLGKVERLL